MEARLSGYALTIAVLALSVAADTWAAAGSPEPPFQTYSVIDGLTQSDVYEIRQDSAGYLWLTTARGLNRYDGANFEQYTIANGLPTNELTALYIDADDTVWVGDARGSISVIVDSSIVQVIKPISAERTPIVDIELVGERMLVVAEGAGILEAVAESDGYRLESLGGKSIGASDLVVSSGNTWLVAASGLYRLMVEPDFALLPVSENVRLAHAAADGTLWVVDLDDRIGTWADGRFELRAIVDSPYAMVDIATCSDGTVWAATYGDLFSFDGSQPGVVQSGNAVREFAGISAVWSLFVDRSSMLWFSGNAGLTRFLGDRFRHFRLQIASETQLVWAISQDPGGRIWFGTETNILVREADETLTVIGSDYGVPSGAVRDLVHDVDGNLWFGMLGDGLFRLKNDAAKSELITGTEGAYILDIGIAPDGAIWYSTLESGVYRYSPNSESLQALPAFGERGIYSLDIADDGSVWYGADGVGLAQLIPQTDGTYGHRFFQAEPGIASAWYSQVRLFGEQEAWLASDDGGLYRFSSGAYADFGSQSPWADQTLYLVELLENGTLIVGGEQGLYQMDPESQDIAHYGRFDGFVSEETNVHATFKDSNGFLWIGTVDGATRMDISQPMPAQQQLVPRILSVLTEQGGISVAQDAAMKPSERGVLIEFAAVSLSRPKAIEFSYKMVGINENWGHVTSNRSVNFSRLAPGEYEFVVRARFEGGNWSLQHSNYRFSVSPFVWQRTWFQAVVALLIVLILWAAITFRTRRISQLNLILRTKVIERTNSIESAKRKLQISNSKLSLEVRQRKKADKARMEIETRFRRAFENVPIGMGLLDAEGRLFDTNPVLRRTFFLDSVVSPQTCFSSAVDVGDRERFELLYEKLSRSKIERFAETFQCISAGGEALQSAVSVSAVRSETGEMQYSVLQVQDVTESIKLTDQLEYHASYDDLTGLMNRRSYESELKKAWEKVRAGDNVCHLLYMDLDQFKFVNDTSGHAAGDELLRRVSNIVLHVVRANDTVCRLGGDEFGIILWDCPADVAKEIAESIRKEIASLRFRWDTQTYRIGASIGCLQIDPDSGGVAELQRLADSACYAAKEAGRNRVHVVAGSDDSARIFCGQIRWVQRLREAIDNNLFEIYSQVILPLTADADEPERVEIMLQLRNSETRKLISPDAFLPAADRYGLSVELDQWVVENLLRILVSRRSLVSEDRQYWVNLSGTSIGDERFARFLTEAIASSPLPPGTINFEIAETAVIRRIAESEKLISSLREMGCHFALDDFGSALSSFDYLKKFPVDFLKIDGSFIRDLLRDKTDRIFVRSIIDIAHELDIKTVAGLVDNAELLQVVRTLGADYAQGMAIGSPILLADSESRSMERSRDAV